MKWYLLVFVLLSSYSLRRLAVKSLCLDYQLDCIAWFSVSHTTFFTYVVQLNHDSISLIVMSGFFYPEFGDVNKLFCCQVSEEGNSSFTYLIVDSQM